LDPDGVPPPALALRGGSSLYCSRRTLNLASHLAAEVSLGTDKTGSGAYGPSGVQGQRPWPSSNPPHFAYSGACAANLALYAARNSVDFFRKAISDFTIYLIANKGIGDLSG
jgi:hypothetical protein